MDLSNARRAIEEEGAKLAAALTRRDFENAAALYTDDAELLPPDAPIIAGRAAVKAFWAEAVPEMAVKTATFTTLDVISSGDLAVEVGTARIDTSGGIANIKYVVAWKRGSDGRWRLHRDIWNAMPV